MEAPVESKLVVVDANAPVGTQDESQTYRVALKAPAGMGHAPGKYILAKPRISMSAPWQVSKVFSRSPPARVSVVVPAVSARVATPVAKIVMLSPV